MRSKSLIFLALVMVLLSVAGTAHGQVVAAAQGSNALLEVGGGVSSWNVNFGTGNMIGITTWGDIHPPVPGFLNGLGAEFEYRYVGFDRQQQPPQFAEETYGGGPIYTFHGSHFTRVRPYVKFLIEGASMYNFANAPYHSDSRTAMAPAGGVQFSLHHGLWLRADYEYQFWGAMFGPHGPEPNGVTVGLSYDLFRRRQ